MGIQRFMDISELRLTNFRSYIDRTFSFGNGLTVVVGRNGAGKTNLLEAIYMSAVGKSFRAGVEIEIVNYEHDFARVWAELGREVKLEVVLGNGVGDNPRKRFLVNGVARRMVDFVGNMRAVLFGPWDMELLGGSPSRRRNYMDTVLSQVDYEYRRSLISYDKGLRQRNRLLEAIRDMGVASSQLFFWNGLLIRDGSYIMATREKFIEFLNRRNRIGQLDLKVKYDQSMISPERLAQYAREEIAAGVTLVGPHRDDFKVVIKVSEEGRDLAKYGSRGEQRMAILWLKMGEVDFVEEKTESRPILLLDDIFSELDHEHRQIVFELMIGQQTIITTADGHVVEGMEGTRIDLN